MRGRAKVDADSVTVTRTSTASSPETSGPDLGRRRRAERTSPSLSMADRRPCSNTARQRGPAVGPGTHADDGGMSAPAPGTGKRRRHREAGLVLENGPGRLRSRASLPWNFGVVEGHDNRIKMLKRRCSAVPASPTCGRVVSWPTDHRHP